MFAILQSRAFWITVAATLSVMALVYRVPPVRRVITGETPNPQP